MNCKVLFLPFFLLILSPAVGQNLVPNGSFEEYSSCPDALDQLQSNCLHWYKSIQIPGEPMNHNPSPDWYHTCATHEDLSPPNTAFGYQEPFEGVAYAAIIEYYTNNPNYREIMGIELSEPLIVGESYRVSFRYSRSEGYVSKLACSGLGIKFSNTAIYESPEEVIDNAPTLYVDSILTDTLDWQEISFEYVAEEAYGFLHLGNFFDDQHTDTVQIDPPYPLQAYYYIDDVRVEQVLGLSDISKGESVIFYPNPAKNVLNVVSESGIRTIIVYSIAGKKLIHRINISRTICELNTSILAKGLYIIEIDTGRNIVRRRFSKL